MKLGDIILQARAELDDQAEPFLWPDDELQGYANEAEQEACRRSRLLIDSTTTAITQMTVTLGDPMITLDSRIIFVRRARLSGQDAPLARSTVREIDAFIPGWEDVSNSTPLAMITDYETGKLRLYPPPVAAGTLKLNVYRLPLLDMNENTDSPEINARFHRSLIHWIKYRAYLKKDSETHDPDEASKALALFEQDFGKRSSAIDETWVQREQMSDPFDGTF